MAGKSTKTKINYDQLKNAVIALLVVLVLILIANNGGFDIGASEAARRNPAKSKDISVEREWPSMALKPTQMATSDWVTPTNPGGPGPANPDPSEIRTPYAFVKATGNVSYGPVYYSSGPELPHIVFSGNAVSPTPSGDYVFFIRVDSLMGNFPSRTTPVKLNVNTGAITTLAAPRDYPRMWNYLVPADGGNDYIYGAMSLDTSDMLTGPIYIVDDGAQVYTTTGSYLFPTLSTDGTKAAWCYDASPNSFGDRDAYIFDVTTQVATRVHNVGASSECQYAATASGGAITAWTVAIYTSGVGLRDQEVWFRPLGSSSSRQIDTLEYRWNEFTRISNSSLPSPLQIVFSGNKDPYVYYGFNVLYASLPFVSKGPGVKAIELTPYSSSTQRIWADVDDSKFVVFSNGGFYSYAMYLAHTDFVGWMTQIINPGNMSRDVSFEN
ncbi:hypothetical protein KKE14_02065 [Patescibacteria group bacterium]|nr:hypothetical protein [Patescibacteria group bacterium]